ncbi:MAG TPA: EAL domain-containing protein, partial [Solirubrobacteraceae bacterium]
VDVALTALEELSALGVSLAIDDFGVGFSSLSQVRRLSPVDVLKIDRSFVAELGAAPQDGAIIAGIVGIAHMLGLTTVAEGIETADQAAGARDLGCDRAQGFHFARPAPPAAMDELLAAAAAGQPVIPAA